MKKLENILLYGGLVGALACGGKLVTHETPAEVMDVKYLPAQTDTRFVPKHDEVHTSYSIQCKCYVQTVHTVEDKTEFTNYPATYKYTLKTVEDGKTLERYARYGMDAVEGDTVKLSAWNNHFKYNGLSANRVKITQSK